MGNRFSSKQVEEAEDVGEIISATRAEIEHLKVGILHIMNPYSAP